MSKLYIYIQTFLKKNEFRTNTLFYTSSSFVTGGFSFILITILTRYLSKQDFGVFENFTAITSLLTGLMLWGNDNNLIQYYKDQSKKNEYNQAVNIVLCQFLLFIILAFITNVDFLKVSRPILISAVFLSAIAALTQIVNISYQYEKKAKVYAIVAISTSILLFVLNIIFVFVFKNYWGRIVSALLSALTIISLIIYPFYKDKLNGFSIDFKKIKIGYIIGLPFFVSLVAAWTIEKSNRFMISSLVSLDEAGVFGVGYQFGTTVLIIKSAISRAWMPYVVENVTSNRSRIRKMLFKLFLSIFLLAILISFLSYFYIEFFIDKKFLRAQLIVPIIAFAYSLDGLWSLYVNIIIYERKYKIYSAITIISGLCNLLFNYLLIPYWGIVGSAIATVMSFAIGAFLSFIYVTYNLKWFK